MRDLEKLADEIARKIDRAVGDAERKVRNKWQRQWKMQVDHTAHDLRSVSREFKRVPNRLSDMATDGSCAMRYLFAYGLKSIAFLMGLGGLIAAATAIVSHGPRDMEQLSVGLSLLVAAQLMWWGSNRIRRSADQRAYARDQLKILRLAREKDGSLTVLETATETRLTVEKAEEILRQLAVGGHAEMRISESGLVVYHFPEIERWDEKRWARPVDEL